MVFPSYPVAFPVKTSITPWDKQSLWMGEGFYFEGVNEMCLPNYKLSINYETTVECFPNTTSDLTLINELHNY